MTKLEKKDYEPLVNEIVENYFLTATPLAEGILKQANALGLTPDQVRQLVWQANTKTHLDLFDKKAEDKIIDFTLADADKILAKVYEEPATVEKSASYYDTTSDFFGVIDFNPLEKVAEDEKPCEPCEVEDKSSKSDKILLIRKAAAEIESKVLEKLCEYEDLIKNQSIELRRLANKHAFDLSDLTQVASDAVGIYGSEVIPVLNDLGLDTERIKKSSAPDTEHPIFKMISSAKEVSDSAIKYAKAFKYLKDNFPKEI